MPRLSKTAMHLAGLVGLLHGLETLVTVAIGRFVPIHVWALLPIALFAGALVGWVIAVRHDHTARDIIQIDEAASGPAFIDQDGQPVPYRGHDVK